MTRSARDASQYAAADRIAAAHPNWMVLWGEWTRLYWAIACRTPEPLVPRDSCPDRLAAAIGRVETAHRPPIPDPARRQTDVPPTDAPPGAVPHPRRATSDPSPQ